MAEENFKQRAERMAALARERGDSEPQPPCESKAEIIQFPLWPEPQRAAPNDFLRSALFSVVKDGARKFMNSETIASWPGVSLRYKGEQLDQYDESVWLQLIHLHRVQGIEPGGTLRIYTRAFLRELGCGYGDHSRKALYKSLERLRANAVTLEGPRGKHIGGLLIEAAENGDGDHWTVIIDPKITRLFAPGHYSRFDWKTRLALPSDLARWLQGYVSSHQATPKQPHRCSLEKLRELSGSTSELKKFRFTVRKCMTALEEAKVVFRWSITQGDALEFVRPKAPPKEAAQEP